MRKSLFCLLAITLLAPAGAFARERTLCEGDGCTDNTLQVVIGDVAAGSSEANVAANDTIVVTVVADVVDAAQGWSMGVMHDTAIAQIDSVSIDGLVLPAEFFNTTVLAVGDPAPGFVAAYVTAIFPPPGASLDPGDDIALVTASYTILAAPGPDETSYIEFSDELVPNAGSPATATNFTVSSNTRKPKTVIDGELKGAVGGCTAPDWALIFGLDHETDLDVTGDTVAINMRNVNDALGLSFGVTHVDGAFAFASETLGTAADRLIENIITDIDGVSQTPLHNAANDAQARAIESVAKGSTIADVTGDFFNADLSPVIGGPGFTVGYVVDVTGTGTVIPATGNTDPCPYNEIVVITLGDGGGDGCDDGLGDWAFSFGDNADIDGNVALADDATEFTINMRNAKEALGFSLAVAVDGTSYSFADDVFGALAGREVDLIITDIDGISQTPRTNTASGGAALDVGLIEKGAAIAAIADDFLTADLAPAVGGSGFTVGYVADTSGTGATIPATPDDSCATNEILVIRLGVGGTPFDRGDCNGDGELNVTDGAISAQNIFLNRIKFFECDDMLDANDDGMLDGSDTITILSWVFLGAADLPAPFQTCGTDETEDDLGCDQSNCQ